MDFSYSSPSKTETWKSCLVCMEWAMQGLLLLLACVKMKSNKYFMDCYRNLVNSISLLYSLPSGYKVRDFFLLARLAGIPILIYSFSYDIGEIQLCLYGIWGGTPEVHPRPFCSTEHKARPDVPRRPARHTFGSQRLGACLECKGGELLGEDYNQKPTGSSVGAVVVLQ